MKANLCLFIKKKKKVKGKIAASQRKLSFRDHQSLNIKTDLLMFAKGANMW